MNSELRKYAHILQEYLEELEKSSDSQALWAWMCHTDRRELFTAELLEAIRASLNTIDADGSLGQVWQTCDQVTNRNREAFSDEIGTWVVQWEKCQRKTWKPVFAWLDECNDGENLVPELLVAAADACTRFDPEKAKGTTLENWIKRFAFRTVWNRFYKKYLDFAETEGVSHQSLDATSRDSDFKMLDRIEAGKDLRRDQKYADESGEAPPEVLAGQQPLIYRFGWRYAVRSSWKHAEQTQIQGAAPHIPQPLKTAIPSTPITPLARRLWWRLLARVSQLK